MPFFTAFSDLSYGSADFGISSFLLLLTFSSLLVTLILELSDFAYVPPLKDMKSVVSSGGLLTLGILGSDFPSLLFLFPQRFFTTPPSRAALASPLTFSFQRRSSSNPPLIPLFANHSAGASLLGFFLTASRAFFFPFFVFPFSSPPITHFSLLALPPSFESASGPFLFSDYSLNPQRGVPLSLRLLRNASSRRLGLRTNVSRSFLSYTASQNSLAFVLTPGVPSTPIGRP